VKRPAASPSVDAAARGPGGPLGAARARAGKGASASLAHAAPEVVQEARALAKAAIAGDRSGVARLLQLARETPSDLQIQIHAGRALEGAVSADDALRIWQELHSRFPQAVEPARRYVRWQLRRHGIEQGRACAREVVAALPVGFDAAMLQAMLLQEFKDADEIQDAYEDLVQRWPAKEAVYHQYAAWLRELGQLEQAASILRLGVSEAETSSRLQRQLAELMPAIASAARVFGTADTARPVSEVALERIFDRVQAAAPVSSGLSFVGPVTMITGSLGSGGAERQLTATAVGLQSAAQEGRELGGYDVIGPVKVICRSLSSRGDSAFFRPDLEAAGVQILEYHDLPLYGGHPRRSLLHDWQEMLNFLPPQIKDGTLRLADTLRAGGAEVVHVWQDGSIFSTAVAAVLARAPRIVLSVRSLPPIDRVERHRPEFLTLYKRLLAHPAVRLTANSRQSAARYAQWLGAPAHRVGVIHNGVSALPNRPLDDSLQLLRQLRERAGAGGCTVGTVMRFDVNKRPTVWLDVAAALLRRRPDASFIMVGDGPLLAASQEHAERLGIAQRVLFTGRRRDVGFWLEQLDALMLLSRHEGLPNVLIEAQLAGAPVLCTPAGGSEETVAPAGKEFILSDAEHVDLDQATTFLDRLLQPEVQARVRPHLKAWTAAEFSVNAMLAATVESYCG
jgi:glycosyltransferase involved in cell wall biosynthesis/tetratricopeptide (TPR) repeat protein